MHTTEIRVELRCPIGPKALLAKVVRSEEVGQRTNDNLLELSCRDCTKRMRQTDPTVSRILHRFNVLGTLIESCIQRFDDSEVIV